MIFLNFVHDYDLLVDTRFLKVLHASEKDRALFYTYVVTYIITLIPRLIGAYGLLKTVIEYYYKKRYHIFRVGHFDEQGNYDPRKIIRDPKAMELLCKMAAYCFLGEQRIQYILINPSMIAILVPNLYKLTQFFGASSVVVEDMCQNLI